MKIGRAARAFVLTLPALLGAMPARSARAEDGETTLVYARGKESPTLDPAAATDGESALVLANVYDTLVRFKYGSADVEPALATSWERAPDGKSMTFHLRPGVKFHDGTKCDGDAVAVNFERQRDEKHPFHFDAGPYSYWGDMFGFVTKTVALDASTVRFEFADEKKPMPPFFLSLLAMFSASIVSPKTLEKGAGAVKSKPCGTGAFRYEGREGDELTLVANPDWWDGRPKLDRLVFVVVPDLRNAYERLESGQVDGIDNVHAKDVARAKGNPSLAVHEVKSGLSICYLALNQMKKPFDDVRVRRAIALAIDKPRMVKTAYQGLATPISTLVPAGIDGHVDIPDRARDVEGAKKLLAEAGAAGRTVTLAYMGNPRPYLPDPNAVAAQLRDDLMDAGLKVELVKNEWQSHLRSLQQGDHEMGLLGWSPDVADADNYLYVLLSKESAVPPANNVSFYKSDAFDALVTKARNSYDPAERRRLYAEAEKVAFDDVAMIPLIAMPRMAATRSSVKGFVLDPISSPRFAWTTVVK